MRVQGARAVGLLLTTLAPSALSNPLATPSVPLSHPPHRHRAATHTRARTYTACRSLKTDDHPHPHSAHTVPTLLVCPPRRTRYPYTHTRTRAHAILLIFFFYHPARAILRHDAVLSSIPSPPPHTAPIPLFRYTCTPLLYRNICIYNTRTYTRLPNAVYAFI